MPGKIHRRDQTVSFPSHHHFDVRRREGLRAFRGARCSAGSNVIGIATR